MTAAVEIQIATESAMPGEDQLRAWAAPALSAAGWAGAGVTIRAVDRGEAQALNRDFRGGDYATNVLSFPFEAIAPEAADDLEAAYCGDLAVCAPVVAAEAHEQGKTLDAHWAHMVVHGVLHLVGFDHQHDAEAEHMEATERRIVAELGFADPYAGEAAPVSEVSNGAASG
jgi:probable rRNA maturation factor